MSDEPLLPRFDERTANDATAALDGDLAATGRADPQLVETLRALRAELADVTAPSDAVRAEAMAAALAEAPAAPVRLDAARARRRRSGWWAGAAAAVLLIVAGAVVASQSSDNGDDEMTAVPAAPTADAATDSGILAAEGSATTRASSSATSTVPAAPAPAATDAAAEETTAAGSTEQDGTTAAGGSGFNIDGPATVLTMIDSPAALAAYARDLDGGDQTPTSTVPVTTSCPLGDVEVLGMISYQGQRSVVVRIRATAKVQARSADGCTVLAEVDGSER